jgi:hypothetical protein
MAKIANFAQVAFDLLTISDVFEEAFRGGLRDFSFRPVNT